MKPDWKDAPEWANWLAMDDCGWAWFEFRPDYVLGCWSAEGMVEVVDELPAKNVTKYFAVLELRK